MSRLPLSFLAFLSAPMCSINFAQAQTEAGNREPASNVIQTPESSAPRSALRSTDKEVPIPSASEEEPMGLSGDWGGKRRTLSLQGMDFAVIGKYEAGRNFTGGQRIGSYSLWNLDIRASLDTAKLGAWKGGSFFAYFLVNQGDDPSTFVGDRQVTSNIETDSNVSRLYEAWYQHLLFDDKVSVLAGVHDLNSEFYVTETSSLFLNASFGIGADLSQTGLSGPSIFPVTAPCFRVRVEPAKSFYLQSAVFSAVSGNPDHPQGTHFKWGSSDGSLLITEAAILSSAEGSEEAPSSKYAVGTWAYTKAVNTLATNVTDGSGNVVPEKGTNHGTYLLLDQGLTESSSAFVRAGFASGEVNQLESNVSAGVALRGPFSFRPKDVVGLAVTMVTASSDYVSVQESSGSPIEKNETTTEFTYRAELTPGLAVQPDLQYVDRPSFSKEISHALAGTVRIELSF